MKGCTLCSSKQSLRGPRTVPPICAVSPIPTLTHLPPTGKDFRAFPTPQHLPWHQCVLTSLPNISPGCSPKSLLCQVPKSCKHSYRGVHVPQLPGLTSCQQSKALWQKRKMLYPCLEGICNIFTDQLFPFSNTATYSPLGGINIPYNISYSASYFLHQQCFFWGIYNSLHMLPIPVQGGLECTSRRLSQTQGIVPCCCPAPFSFTSHCPSLLETNMAPHPIIFSLSTASNVPSSAQARSICHTSCVERSCL